MTMSVGKNLIITLLILLSYYYVNKDNETEFFIK